ncbi:MAG: hypothetical protein J6S85_05780 [Methanobrevibacter sp.]|nr:hypothetical protein [Methanobrevibacter sp.]
MKIKVSAYPYGVIAETKTSKAGNSYTSIGVWQKTKDKDGNKKENFLNMIDERDLLVLARVCEDAYLKIVYEKTAERFKDSGEKDIDNSEPADYDSKVPAFDDDIPF